MHGNLPPITSLCWWSSNTDGRPLNPTFLAVRVPLSMEQWEYLRAWDAQCERLQQPTILTLLLSTGCRLIFEARADEGAIEGPLAG